jgi:hypothetical protein
MTALATTTVKGDDFLTRLSNSCPVIVQNRTDLCDRQGFVNEPSSYVEAAEPHADPQVHLRYWFALRCSEPPEKAAAFASPPRRACHLLS